MRFFLFSMFLVLATRVTVGQQIITPGQMYQPEQEVYSPTLGFKVALPEHWAGILPEGSSIFLLSNTQGYEGEIYVLGDTTNFSNMRSGWLQGLELDKERILKSDGTIIEEEGLLSTKVILAGGGNRNKQAYIVGRCGPYNRCISALLIGGSQHFNEMKQKVINFVKQVEFVEPELMHAYANFDWKQFLSFKKAVYFGSRVGTKSVNEVWFCEDGSFKSKLKRTGIVKGEIGKYKGKHKGTWSTTSFGANGTLLLKFDKLPPVEVELLIKDDKVYFNDKYHVLTSAKGCP